MLITGLVLMGFVLIREVAERGSATAIPPTSTPDISEDGGIFPITPPQPLTDFAFIRDDGSSIRLSDLSANERYTLVYFGYVNCPDFCPLTMVEFTRVKRLLGERADSFNFALISIDPERDTPPDIRAYLDRYDPAFIGIQGETVALEQIADEYGLSITIPPPGSTAVPHNMPGMDMSAPDAAMTAALDGDYLVNHTTYTYLIDPQGRLSAIFSFNTTAEAIVRQIERVMDAAP